MINKLQMLKRLEDEKFVLVLRANSEDEAIDIAKNSILGGINVIELTFTVPNATSVISTLNKLYEDDSNIIIGAGTVFDSETARMAILSGAKFIVSPVFDEGTCKLCNRYGVPYIPGCFTPTEVIKARECGVDIVKLFPGSAFDPSIIKDIKAPIRGIGVMVSGGVNYGNINKWFECGADVVSIGSAITSIENKETMKEEAKRYIDLISEFRSEVNGECFSFR